MTLFDYVLLIAAVLVMLYQLNLLRRIKRDVTIPGASPNRKTLMIIIGVVLVFALVRNSGNLATTWPVMAAIALACMMMFMGGSGLSAEGMYSNGTFISFPQAIYYDFDERPDGTLVFRLSRMTKEGVMVIEPGQQAQIKALMEEKGIPTQDEYHGNLTKQAVNKAAAKQKRKKKKK